MPTETEYTYDLIWEIEESCEESISQVTFFQHKLIGKGIRMQRGGGERKREREQCIYEQPV